MLSKAKVKYIKSLQIKKFRKQNGEFLVEGAKSVIELLNSDFQISTICLTDNFIAKNPTILNLHKGEVITVKQQELEELGTFSSNNAAIAIAKVKENNPLYIEKDEFILLLDEVKDPGNLGTIIRIADWYGIEKIVCSEEVAEFYNPKVISATMGSFTRTRMYYCNLVEYLSKNRTDVVYGAALDGKNIHNMEFKKRGYLIMGNESSGINPIYDPFINDRIMIPGKGKAESLNVAVATAIICDNIIR